MSTIFSKILAGDIPGEVFYEDDLCFALLDINPQRPGHTLLIPKEEVGNVLDLSDELTSHIFCTAKNTVGPAIQAATGCGRIGYVVEGFGVSDHVHLHLVPITNEGDLDGSYCEQATPENLSKMAELLRSHI